MTITTAHIAVAEMRWKMTREEAIEILKPFKACMFDQHGCPISDAAIALDVAIEALEQQQWIPVTYRPAEGDELKHYMYMFTCDMPADEQDILVTVKGRHGTLWVERDVNYCKDGFTLDSGNDWRDVEAWMPLPKPYQEDNQ